MFFLQPQLVNILFIYKHIFTSPLLEGPDKYPNLVGSGSFTFETQFI